jgi:hypothetical protein
MYEADAVEIHREIAAIQRRYMPEYLFGQGERPEYQARHAWHPVDLSTSNSPGTRSFTTTPGRT